jgi:hypothetical protein
MLSRLKLLRLSGNALSGTVHPLIIKLIATNGAKVDLSQNQGLIVQIPDGDRVATSFAGGTKGREATMLLTPPTLSRSQQSTVSPMPPSLQKQEQQHQKQREEILNQWDDVERYALMDLYNSSGGTRWLHSEGWGTSRPFNTWYGVTVNKQGRVVGLQLASNNLSGECACMYTLPW